MKWIQKRKEKKGLGNCRDFYIKSWHLFFFFLFMLYPIDKTTIITFFAAFIFRDSKCDITLNLKCAQYNPNKRKEKVVIFVYGPISIHGMFVPPQ